MKIYAPNKLIQVVSRVAEEFPLSGTIQRDISQEDLKELVLAIDAQPEENLADFSLTVTRRARQALCRYLRTNAYQVSLQKIAAVIRYGMNQGCYKLLFAVWQDEPECREAIQLLGEFDTDDYRDEDIPVQKGLLKQWAAAEDSILAVSQTAMQQTHYERFSERLEATGLAAGTALSAACKQRFFARATAAEFRREGDKEVAQVLQRSTKMRQEEVLVQLMRMLSGERDALTKFTKTYEYAKAMWREPRSGLLQEHHAELLPVYRWWYNYNEMISVMYGDYRRIIYWEQFLDQCECYRDGHHRMLIMRFNKYVVTEFEEMGPVYIFEQEYFDRVVADEMKHTRQTSALKSWLWNNYGHVSKEIHNANWESKQTAALRRYGLIR